MITINKASSIPPFSRLRHNPLEARKEKSVTFECTELGFIIAYFLKNFHQFAREIAIYDYAIMPDHIHFILRINHKMEEALGKHMARFKRSICLKAIENNVVSEETKTIFQGGFNDQFLRWDRSLTVLKNYIRANPYRLWIRQTNPGFFTKLNNQIILGEECQIYGNRALLQSPFIEPVIIHRSYSPEDRIRLRQIWEYTYRSGGVLIGAFISPDEREIFKTALQNEGKIILLSNHYLEEREKPAGKLIEHCEKGNLLIITPAKFKGRNSDQISRDACLHLNSLAEKIAAGRN